MKRLYIVGSSSKIAASIEKLAGSNWEMGFYGRTNPHGLGMFTKYPGVEDEKSVNFLRDLIVEDLKVSKNLEEAGLVILSGVSSNDWRLSYYVNEYMPATLSDAFAKQAASMELANCSIVLMNSSGVYQGAKLSYATTKASLTGILHAVSRDYKGKVRVNVILPSAFDSGMISDWDEEKRNVVAGSNYIGRLGTADDMADAILFALGNKFITNSTINMTGGTIHI